jgi:hypothetical protein
MNKTKRRGIINTQKSKIRPATVKILTKVIATGITLNSLLTLVWMREYLRVCKHAKNTV